jgi:hypothetical protein
MRFVRLHTLSGGERIIVARLFDRLIANGFKVPPSVRRDHPDFVRAIPQLFEKDKNDITLVQMDSVGRWMFSESEKDHWTLGKDIPYVRSPFERAFYEVRLPRVMRNRAGSYRDTRDWWGFYLRVHERESYMDWMLKRSGDPPPERSLADRLYDPRIDEAKWIQEAVMFWELENRKGTVYGPLATWFMPVMEDGTPVKAENGVGLSKVIPLISQEEFRITAAPNGVFDENVVGQEFAPFMDVVWMTISLMHCKNTNLVENSPPEKLSKKWRKKTGKPLKRFYTLEVKPMGVRKNGSASGGEGKGVALHRRRGHFKNFSEEKPLFGKYVGTWWWGERMVGSLGYGEVEKDYSVKGRSLSEAHNRGAARPVGAAKGD